MKIGIAELNIVGKVRQEARAAVRIKNAIFNKFDTRYSETNHPQK